MATIFPASIRWTPTFSLHDAVKECVEHARRVLGVPEDEEMLVKIGGTNAANSFVTCVTDAARYRRDFYEAYARGIVYDCPTDEGVGAKLEEEAMALVDACIPYTTTVNERRKVGLAEHMKGDHPGPMSVVYIKVVRRDVATNLQAFRAAWSARSGNPYILKATGQDKFSLNEDKYSLKQDKYSLNEDKYSLNEDKFSLNEDKYSLKQDKFSLNEDKYSLKQDKFSLNEDKYSLLQDAYSTGTSKFSTGTAKLVPKTKEKSPRAVPNGKPGDAILLDLLYEEFQGVPGQLNHAFSYASHQHLTQLVKRRGPFEHTCFDDSWCKSRFKRMKLAYDPPWQVQA